MKYISHCIFFISHSTSFKCMTTKEQLEISPFQYSGEKGEFKLQKKLGANTQIPTFQMLFPAEIELGFCSNSRNSEHMSICLFLIAQ